MRYCKCIQLNSLHPKLQQSMMGLYGWQRQLGIIRSSPFKNGCLFKVTQACAVFTGVPFLSLSKYPSLSLINTIKVPLSGSLRSWGHLSASLRDEDDIQRLTGKIKPHQVFAAHSGSCLSWRLCQGPRGLWRDGPSEPRQGQLQDKCMTSVLCGTEKAQWTVGRARRTNNKLMGGSKKIEVFIRFCCSRQAVSKGE